MLILALLSCDNIENMGRTASERPSFSRFKQVHTIERSSAKP